MTFHGLSTNKENKPETNDSVNISEGYENVTDTLKNGCQVICVNLSSTMMDSDNFRITEQMSEEDCEEEEQITQQ
jgi:hypothetical protein